MSRKSPASARVAHERMRAHRRLGRVRHSPAVGIGPDAHCARTRRQHERHLQRSPCARRRRRRAHRGTPKRVRQHPQGGSAPSAGRHTERCMCRTRQCSMWRAAPHAPIHEECNSFASPRCPACSSIQRARARKWGANARMHPSTPPADVHARHGWRCLTEYARHVFVAARTAIRSCARSALAVGGRRSATPDGGSRRDRTSGSSYSCSTPCTE